jgi:TonB family protein
MMAHDLWERVMPPERRWFGLILLVVALAHGAVVVLLRLEMPMGRVHHARARQVTLITERLQSPVLGGGNWAAWLDWRDPSAVALPWTPLPAPALPPVDSGLPGSPVLPPVDPARGELPDTLPGGLEERAGARVRTGARDPMPIPVEAPPRLSGTRYRIDWARAERKLLSNPQLPQPRTDLSLRRTQLSVLVNRLGLVESVLVLESSGDDAVDQTAVREVRGWRFAADPAAPELESAQVSVFWDLKEKEAPRRIAEP